MSEILKSDYDVIYTFNSRSDGLWDGLREENVDGKEIKKSIWEFKNELVTLLKNKNIDYKDLKNVLVPQDNKKEMVLFFKITKNWYGKEIENQVYKVLTNLKLNTNMLIGDLLIYPNRTEIKSCILKNYPNVILEEDFELYCVYLNNLSDQAMNNIDSQLASFHLYRGYINTTYDCWIKKYLSTILVWSLILYKNKTITNEYHVIDKPQNLIALPTEEIDVCTPFLWYKIERDGNKDDLRNCLNVLTEKNIDVNSLKVVCSEEKVKYILENHENGFHKLGLSSKEKEEIENELKRLINNNYIFNIRICKNYGTLMFSVILEKNNKRATIGLKYDAKNNIANVVTLF